MSRSQQRKQPFFVQLKTIGPEFSTSLLDDGRCCRSPFAVGALSALCPLFVTWSRAVGAPLVLVQDGPSSGCVSVPDADRLVKARAPDDAVPGEEKVLDVVAVLALELRLEGDLRVLCVRGAWRAVSRRGK